MSLDISPVDFEGRNIIQSYGNGNFQISDKQYELFESLLDEKAYLVSTYQNWIADIDIGTEKIKSHFKIKSLKGFGLDENILATISAGASLFYIDENHQENSKHIQYCEQ